MILQTTLHLHAVATLMFSFVLGKCLLLAHICLQQYCCYIEGSSNQGAPIDSRQKGQYNIKCI